MEHTSLPEEFISLNFLIVLMILMLLFHKNNKKTLFENVSQNVTKQIGKNNIKLKQNNVNNVTEV